MLSIETYFVIGAFSIRFNHCSFKHIQAVLCSLHELERGLFPFIVNSEVMTYFYTF
jgi:hypothetical protein